VIAQVVEAFLELLTALVQAGADAEKQQAALMAAETRLATARARTKFGGGHAK
jgi:hypothetical protein